MADLTTLPQVATAPSSVGVAFLDCFLNDSRPVVAARGSGVIWEVRQVIAVSLLQVVLFPWINRF